MDADKDPLLIEVPERIETERLILRPPRAGDGAAMNEAILETIDLLQQWMPWSRPTPTVDQSEANCRQAGAQFILRKELPLMILLKDGTVVGRSGLHYIDWKVPRFEIGYWARASLQGRGYITEAAAAIARMAFEQLGARRIEIRMDDRNERSWRVAERLGFTLECIMRNERRALDGSLASSRVYARISDG